MIVEIFVDSRDDRSFPHSVLLVYRVALFLDILPFARLLGGFWKILEFYFQNLPFRQLFSAIMQIKELNLWHKNIELNLIFYHLIYLKG